MSKLPIDFYRREGVLQVSRDLLGKLLVTELNGVRTSGFIVETEAYRGPEDKAAHSYGGRRTKRTETMYLPGGVAYVYLCYGIHHLFNVVAHQKDVPHAILVRAIEPEEGIPFMLKRRNQSTLKPALTAGPGSLTKALGIRTIHDRTDLTGRSIWIEDRGRHYTEDQIIASPRVGVGYAGDHAQRPWRFRVKGNKWVSRAK